MHRCFRHLFRSVKMGTISRESMRASSYAQQLFLYRQTECDITITCRAVLSFRALYSCILHKAKFIWKVFRIEGHHTYDVCISLNQQNRCVDTKCTLLSTAEIPNLSYQWKMCGQRAWFLLISEYSIQPANPIGLLIATDSEWMLWQNWVCQDYGQ